MKPKPILTYQDVVDFQKMIISDSVEILPNFYIHKQFPNEDFLKKYEPFFKKIS